jgi:drug/metabolite transporter (DMT)-like permease
MPVLLLFFAVLFWSGHNVVAKGIIEFVPPLSFTFARWFLASLIILPIAWPHLKSDWQKAIKWWPRLLLIAATGICAFNCLLYIALQTTSAVNVGLISSIFPVTIALFSHLILNVSLSRPQVIGMVICFMGVVVVIFRGDISSVTTLEFVVGDLWMLLGVFCGALYPVLLHKKPDIHPLSLLAVLIILGALTSLPLFLYEVVQGEYIQLNQQVITGLIVIAIFPSVLSYMCWNRGIELVGANHAGLFLNLVPILTAILAYIFIDEIISWYHYLGLFLIIGGIWLFNITRKQSLA